MLMRKILLLLLLFTCFSCKEDIEEEERDWDWNFTVTNGTNEDRFLQLRIIGEGIQLRINKNDKVNSYNVADLCRKYLSPCLKETGYSFVWVTEYDKPYGNEIKSKKLTPEDNIFVCE